MKLLSQPLDHVRQELGQLGYYQDMLKDDWLTQGSDAGIGGYEHFVAFWGRPFDQFRSAVAAIRRNGIADKELARQVARESWAHVVTCGNDTFRVWLLADKDVEPACPEAPWEKLHEVFASLTPKLNKAGVARAKLRLRQYALYETDPSGHAFGQWAIQPRAEQALATIRKLVHQVVPTVTSGADVAAASAPSTSREIRWLFRVFALRLGLDRGWLAAQGLGREDVGSMIGGASSYPRPWTPDMSPVEIQRLTEDILKQLQFNDFSKVDPILMVRALAVRRLNPFRASFDLFPTPGTTAWDLVASLPITLDQRFCDATSGTGTFLVTAGHRLWDRAGGDDQVKLLKQALVGGDQSPFSTDLSTISLDLAFGQDGQPWTTKNQLAGKTIADLDPRDNWVLLGNLPWSGRGRSENEASEILREYLRFQANQPTGWVATLTPRSIWTYRAIGGQKLRDLVAGHFSIEQVWELGWDSVAGGRAQAVATVLSRRPRGAAVRTPIIWKREDISKAITPIGYVLPKDESPFPLRSPDAYWLQEKLAEYTTLGTLFHTRLGLQPITKQLLEPFENETPRTIPFILSPSKLIEHWIPESILQSDQQAKAVFLWRAENYRSELARKGQFAITQTLYEGVHRLQVFTPSSRVAFSNRFLVCVPKEGVRLEVGRAVARVLNSAFGRLWIHLFALAGRHVSKNELEKFPLPRDVTSGSGGVVGPSSPLVLPWRFEERKTSTEFDVLKAYGFKEDECLAVLKLASMLGLCAPPKVRVSDGRGTGQRLRQVRKRFNELASIESEDLTSSQRQELVRLWDEGLELGQSNKFLIQKASNAEVSIPLG